jgi:hypothetical protein
MTSSTDLEAVIAGSPLALQPGIFAVARVRSVPAGISAFAVCSDGNETTIIARQDLLKDEWVESSETGYRLVAANVSVPFNAPGFLAAIAGPLAAKGINLLMVSTFSRDYFLVRQPDLNDAIACLAERGFPIEPDQESSDSAPSDSC